MKSGGEVSPVVAGIIIAIIVIVAGFFLWRMTGAKKGEVQDKEKMKEVYDRMFKPGRSGGSTAGGMMPGAGHPSGSTP